AMDLLGEAARMKRSEELRAEAIATITSPGLRLQLQVPFPGEAKAMVSPDSKLVALAGNRDDVLDGVRSHFMMPKAEVWNLQSAAMVSHIEDPIRRPANLPNPFTMSGSVYGPTTFGFSPTSFAFSPTDPLIATAEKSLVLWS